MTSSGKPPTELGKILLKRLDQLSWSIAEAGRRTKLTRNTINNAIYGPREPQRKTLEILAEALDLPAPMLIRTSGLAATTAEPVSFGRWIFRRDNKYLWVALAGSLATGLFVFRELPLTSVSAAVQGVQAVVILVLLAMLPRPWTAAPEVYQKASHRLKLASKAAEDLRGHWGRVWLLWFFLYATLTVTTYLGVFPWGDGDPTSAQRWTVLLLNLIQNGVTIQLFLCYEVVARPTIGDDFSRREVLPREAWPAVITVVTGLEVAWILGGLPYQPAFGWISGFGQGTALALLVGRFDSKYVDPPALVIGLLYLYAAIQGAWPAFRDEGELMQLLTFVALVLKCLLFLFVTWLFASRIIHFYLTRMRELDQEVQRDKEEFLQRLHDGDVERL